MIHRCGSYMHVNIKKGVVLFSGGELYFLIYLVWYAYVWKNLDDGFFPTI